jgi:hypothetical protein
MKMSQDFVGLLANGQNGQDRTFVPTSGPN